MDDMTTEGPGLPTYEESAAVNHRTVEDLLPPETLCISDRFIRSETTQGAPLYELSHHIDSLKESDRKVIMQKLEKRVYQNDGEPIVKTRNRALFHLIHPKPGEACHFLYQGESQSRQAISIGIERADSLLKQGKKYRVTRARWGADRRLNKDGEDILFAAIAMKESDRVSWEWRNNDEEIVAREITEDGVLSLVVTAQMTTQARDALVASWYLRTWWARAEETYEKPGFREQGRFYYHAMDVMIS